MASPAVVTLSAPYGAGGSQIGPRLARELGVPFVDRAIPTAVAARLALPLQSAVAHDESVPGTLDRLLRSLSVLAPVTGVELGPEPGERTFAAATEDVIREHAATTGGVILGRAWACVLADHPGALHVRLTGAAERRIEQAMQIEGVDRETAERRCAETDAMRDAYVRQLYRCDAHDAALYHLVLDTTALPLEDCVAIIARAARAAIGAPVSPR